MIFLFFFRKNRLVRECSGKACEIMNSKPGPRLKTDRLGGGGWAAGRVISGPGHQGFDNIVKGLSRAAGCRSGPWKGSAVFPGAGSAWVLCGFVLVCVGLVMMGYQKAPPWRRGAGVVLVVAWSCWVIPWVILSAKVA
jgi:hypothetical protein